MTDLLHADPVARTAVAEAARAARASGVTVRELGGVEDQARVVRMLSEIWGRTADNPIVPPELLRAFGKAGNYIVGAFAGQELVGGTIAFHSTPERQTLHSHIAGVSSAFAGHAVGFAMKLHQRGWALSHGVDVVEWTFDPLVARNAYFNIAKLHAMPTEYLANFYGAMTDAINGGDDSDRLLVRWELRDPGVVAAAAGRRLPLAATSVTVAVPTDIERLRVTDPARARDWRCEVRDRLASLMDGGGRVVGFTRDDGYLVNLEEAQ